MEQIIPIVQMVISKTLRKWYVYYRYNSGISSVKNLSANAGDVGWVKSPGWEDPREKEMATNSNILAWEMPWTEEPGGLQSVRSQRVRHDLATEQRCGRLDN